MIVDFRSPVVRNVSTRTFFAELECNISIDVSRRWEGYLVNPEKDGEIITEIDLSELDSVSKSMLYVPEFFFDPGFYKLRYNVNMSGELAFRLLFDSLVKRCSFVCEPLSPSTETRLPIQLRAPDRQCSTGSSWKRSSRSSHR